MPFRILRGQKKNDDGYYELFGTEYAQYVKLDFDFSKGIVLDSRNKLAFHIEWEWGWLMVTQTIYLLSVLISRGERIVSGDGLYES